MANPRLALVVFILLVVGTLQCYGGSSSGTNATRVTLDDEEDEILPSGMDIVAFKERYRRLIPYMTYYFGNNYIGSQTSTPPNYERSPQGNFLMRRPQYTLVGPDDAPRTGTSYQTSLQSQEEKFVPSVQYDPKDVRSNNNYFTPVRYSTKTNYEDYSSAPLHRPYQKQRPIYAQVTTLAGVQDDQFFTTIRPLRPYSLSSQREYLPRKPSMKPVNTNMHRDYLLDFITRPSGKLVTVNNDFKYPVDFEPVRYAKPESSRISQPFRPSESSVPRQPPMVLNLSRNPNVNLNHIVKSLQLTNQLPEMLNTNNIDSSIKTLVEILSILNSAKKNEPSTQQIPIPPKATQNFPNYIDYKAQRTGLKISPGIKHHTTLAPIVVPDKPTHYKPESPYVTNIELKTPSQSDYYPDDTNDPKVIRYYTPLTQDIDIEDEERYVPTNKPQNAEQTTEHSYEITEDLKDDILVDEKFILPPTTKIPVHNYPRPDGVSSHAQIIPPTALKYGATRGKPNIDYPAYATIPETEFSCKNQRYKGFFGDPATGCQVWHYCDLNGGKSSFLCPNGTIFNQVALTCDWWFNVKCESTTQLYVLNERLYKFILPLMPKFPEDFTGPEVDRYLELKFKEMEEKLKEKKLKKQQEEKEKVENELKTVDDAE